MRKLFMIFFVLAAVLTGAERMVLGELFTSTTCSPCVQGNANLTDLLSQKESYLAVVRFHMNWPPSDGSGNDPFYRYNPQENGNRRGFYAINGVPTLVVDGTKSSEWGTDIDSCHAIESPLRMKLYRQFDQEAYAAVQGKGTILVEIVNEEAQSYTFKLYGALTESNVKYTGTNGDPVHHQAMIDLFPYAFGTDVTLGPSEDALLAFEFKVDDTIPFLNTALEPTGETHIVDATNSELVLWGQIYSTKEVLQAAKIKVPGAKAVTVSDIKLQDATGDGKLSAGEQAEVHLKVTNGSSSEITGVRVFVEVDNSKVSVLKGVAEIAEIPAGASVVLEGADLLVKAGPDYKNEGFAVTCYAGSSDGSLGFAVHDLDVEESPSEDVLFSLPSIAKPGSILYITPVGASRANLSVCLFDACGRFVENLYEGSASALSEIRLPSVCSGVYFLRLSSMDCAKTAKLILLN